jgi:hypothetical protein
LQNATWNLFVKKAGIILRTLVALMFAIARRATGVFQSAYTRAIELASHIGRYSALTDDNEIIGWTGESDFDWMAEQSETVAIRTGHPLDPSTESRHRMAFPKVIEIAAGVPSDKWIVICTFSQQVAASLETEIRVQFPDLEMQERFG